MPCAAGSERLLGSMPLLLTCISAWTLAYTHAQQMLTCSRSWPAELLVHCFGAVLILTLLACSLQALL
jgi:hypothetical protein